MATTRNQPAPDETDESGLSEGDWSRIEEMIQRAVGGAKPPAQPEPAKTPAVTDDEWDKMSDRQRESWVRSLVDDTLDKLRREDDDRRRDDEIRELQEAAKPKPEPEAVPDTITRLRKFIWGEQK